MAICRALPVALATAILLCGVLPCMHGASASIASDPSLLASTTFDYVIIGGGTAGLVLAARLSENKDVQVVVIEAGEFHDDDPLIDVPAFAGRAWGNPDYDWSFVTVPQPGANGRSIINPRGKMLGGSSGLNNLAWCHATRTEYDVWHSFAQTNDWTWDGLNSYFKKVEAVFPDQTGPDISVAAYDTNGEGFTGPVQTAFNTWYSDAFTPYFSAVNNLGVTTNLNPDIGNTTGIFDARSNVDRRSGTRSYAASAYYKPVQARKNIHVLLNSQATKILLKPSEGNGDEFTATGVQLSSGSRSFAVRSTREVILSAGSYQSPQLLELSGIGNKSILENVGISPLIDLPEVGENLQDHLFTSVQYQLQPGFVTFDALKNNITFATQQSAIYNRTHSGILGGTNTALAFLPLSLVTNESQFQSLVHNFDNVVAGSNPSPLQSMQYSVQREWLIKDAVPQVELIMWSQGLVAGNASYITVFAGGLHHLNRGSVHINSTDGLQRPNIDASWLTNDFDVQVILQALKLVQKLGNIEPLSNIINSTFSPPQDVQDDAALIDYIRESVGSAFHPMGTNAMAPRDVGGVVDGSLKVYGTKNLRVCDASILPLSIGTHLQWTVFAMAEKLADILKIAQ